MFLVGQQFFDLRLVEFFVSWSFQCGFCLFFICWKCLGFGFEVFEVVGEVGCFQGMFFQFLIIVGCFVFLGLQVILYINEEEYNFFLVFFIGVKVIIYRQDEYFFVEDVGTEIETAMVIFIGMYLVRGYFDFCRFGEEGRFFLGIIKEVRFMEKGVGFKREYGFVFF